MVNSAAVPKILSRGDLSRVLGMFRSLPSYSGRSGRFEIVQKKIPAGQKICVVGFRQAFFSGGRSQSITFNRDIVCTELKEEDGVWMTTSLQELAQMESFLRRAKGRIFVGGLGLGCIAHLLAGKYSVNRIVVVEREPDLIRLIAPQISSRVEIVCADLFRYLPTIKSRYYSSAFLDTWQGTGEWSWQTQVVPLRRAIGSKIRRVECWQETEMHGQVSAMLFRVADMSAEILADQAASQHYWVFRKAVEYLRPKPRLLPGNLAVAKCQEVEDQNKQDPMLVAATRFFLEGVGTEVWEQRFGKLWDQTLEWPDVKVSFRREKNL